MYMFTAQDWAFLAQRGEGRVSASDRELMESATWLVESNAAVHSRCLRKLLDVANLHENPVVVITAQCSPPKAKLQGSRNCGGLVLRLFLARDAPVLLLRNLFTAGRLVNGSRGTLRELWYPEGTSPLAKHPESSSLDVGIFGDVTLPVAIVEFPCYNGPAFFQEEAKRNWVPIPACESDVEGVKGGKRRQLPLVLAYAITVWKSQGMSLDAVVIQLRERLMEHGIVYVAVSRAKHFTKLFFRGSLPSYEELIAVCSRKASLQFIEAQALLRIEAREFERIALRPWGPKQCALASAVTDVWLARARSGGILCAHYGVDLLSSVCTHMGDVSLREHYGGISAYVDASVPGKFRCLCRLGFGQAFFQVDLYHVLGRLNRDGVLDAMQEVAEARHGQWARVSEMHGQKGKGKGGAVAPPGRCKKTSEEKQPTSKVGVKDRCLKLRGGKGKSIEVPSVSTNVEVVDLGGVLGKCPPSVSFIPCRGLRNGGNRCFAISVLQCLVSHPAISEWSAHTMHSRANCLHTDNWATCPLCYMQNMVHVLRTSVTNTDRECSFFA